MLKSNMHNSQNNHGVRHSKAFSAVAPLILAAVLVVSSMHASPARAQSQSQAASAAAPTLEYEVATIKPNKTDIAPAAMTTDDGIDMRNVPLRILLSIAFGLSGDRITAGPDWINDRYDVSAKMDPAVADALKKLNPLDRRTARQHMLQTLLIERFKIVYHRDTKELPVFLMVVAKGGPKLQEGKPADASPEGVGGTGTMQFGEGGLLTFKAMPLSSLLQILSLQVGRAVLDKTGLSGRYDFTWQFNQGVTAGAGRGGAQPPAAGPTGGANPAASADSEPPSIFTVLQEELGLRLDSGKGPVEIIVIDQIERPSGN